MAGKRIDIMDLRQLIILKKSGASNRKIGKLLDVSRNTVNTYCQLLDGLKLEPNKLLAMDDAALKELCAPESEISAERKNIQMISGITF